MPDREGEKVIKTSTKRKNRQRIALHTTGGEGGRTRIQKAGCNVEGPGEQREKRVKQERFRNSY